MKPIQKTFLDLAENAEYELTDRTITKVFTYEKYALFIDYSVDYDWKIRHATHYQPEEVTYRINSVDIDCELYRDGEEKELPETFDEQIETIIKNYLQTII